MADSIGLSSAAASCSASGGALQQPGDHGADHLDVAHLLGADVEE
jgi:hypothetical protein